MNNLINIFLKEYYERQQYIILKKFTIVEINCEKLILPTLCLNVLFLTREKPSELIFQRKQGSWDQDFAPGSVEDSDNTEYFVADSRLLLFHNCPIAIEPKQDKTFKIIYHYTL